MQAPRQSQKHKQDEAQGHVAVHPSLLPSILAAALQQSQATATTAEPRVIPFDILKRPQRFIIRADLPGVRQDEIVLQSEGNLLSLSIEKDKNTEQEGVRVHRRERGQSFASRSIRLPETCDLDKIQADVENGVLEIIVPKIQETFKHRTIKVGKVANGP